MKRSLLARLMLVELVALATFGALEVTARWWLESGASEAAFRRFATVEQIARLLDDFEGGRFTAHRYIGYRPNPGYATPDGLNRHNSLGYRGEEIVLPKPEGEFRIVCLGGSTTYTTSVRPDVLAYPQQLELNLRERGRTQVTVVNSGCPAWSTYESMINFQFRVLDLDPDMIIVYHAVNDIHTRVVWPPEWYRGDNAGRRGPVVSGTFVPVLWQESALLRILGISAGLAEPQSWVSPERILFTEGPPTFYAHRFLHQWTKGEYPDTFFKRVSVQQMLDTNPPVYYERNLETIIALARQHGVQVMMATFVTAPEFPDARSSSPEYQAEYDVMNAIMQRVCERNGVPCFDLASVFPRTAEYFDDGHHVNQKGSILKARMFAQFILSRGLVPEP